MDKVVCIYDNKNLKDRYTVIFESGDALAISEQPESPTGFHRWILVDEYDENKLGIRVLFSSLPVDIQKFIREKIRQKNQAADQV